MAIMGVATYATAWLLDRSKVPLGEAIQLLATIAVAAATILYVRLTGELVRAQNSQLKEMQDARRVTALLGTASDAHRVMHDLIDASLDFPHRFQDDLVTLEFEDRFVEAYTKITSLPDRLYHHGIQLHTEDLKRVEQCTRVMYDLIISFGSLGSSVTLALERSDGQPTPWSEVRAIYYTDVRDPKENPEWEPLFTGAIVDGCIGALRELVADLRKRAGV